MPTATALLRPVLPAQRSRNMPRKQTAKGGAGRSKGRTCLWCESQLGANPRALTCSPSCRSCLSRKKRAQCARALEELGMPRPVALKLLDRFGLPVVEQKLNDLGWVWYPRLKNWFNDGVENWRAA
jgi:hypothetical protein